jgi:hypothetical protein
MNLSALCRGEPSPIKAPGAYSMERDAYDNLPAFSRTVLLKWISLGAIPSEFAYWLRNRWEEPISESQLIGSALDCMLLESQQFANRFAVVPQDAPSKPNSRTRNAKNPSPASQAAIAWWNKFEGDAAQKQILTHTQCTTCLEMRLALSQADSVQGVFEHCKKTVLIGELFNFPAKAEIDLWNERIPHILDLKSAVDVSPTAFSNAAIKFGYLEQATFYLELAHACGFPEKKIFSFVAIKNERPWTVKVYSFTPFEDPDHFILYDAARRKLSRAATTIADRLETNNFQDPQDWELMQFPEWTLRQAKMETLLPIAA